MPDLNNLKKLSDFDNKSLLIVDDDNPFRERLARAMEKKGFDVIQAEGVQKGIDSVKEKKPGFAVVDLRFRSFFNGIREVNQRETVPNPRYISKFVCSHVPPLSHDLSILVAFR